MPSSGGRGGRDEPRCGHSDRRLPGVAVVEEAMIKLMYKPISLLVSVLGGMLAGAIFKRIWKLAAREDDAPKATDAGRGWPEILSVAALQGARYTRWSRPQWTAVPPKARTS